MAELFTLSRNELWALLTRTFEALYGHDADYYDMARTALWLECHGLHGVAGLVAALPILEKTDLQTPELIKVSDTVSRFDAGGHSLFCVGRTVCDLAMANANEANVARIDIVNCAHPNVLIGLLSYISLQNICAAVTCGQQTAVIKNSRDCPDIYSSPNDKTISVICARDKSVIEACIPEGAELVLNQQNLRECFDNHLAGGIRVEKAHYAQLNTIADRVLVEASEASRRGAGE